MTGSAKPTRSAVALDAWARRGACHRAAFCADPLAPLPALPSRLGRGFEQVAPDLLERFDLLTGEPGGGGDGAGFGFVGELAQAVADEVRGVCGIESFVQCLFHVEAERHQLFRGGAGCAHRLADTLAWRRHGVTPANPAMYATLVCRFCYVN